MWLCSQATGDAQLAMVTAAVGVAAACAGLLACMPPSSDNGRAVATVRALETHSKPVRRGGTARDAPTIHALLHSATLEAQNEEDGDEEEEEAEQLVVVVVSAPIAM